MRPGPTATHVQLRAESVCTTGRTTGEQLSVLLLILSAASEPQYRTVTYHISHCKRLLSQRCGSCGWPGWKKGLTVRLYLLHSVQYCTVLVWSSAPTQLTAHFAAVGEEVIIWKNRSVEYGTRVCSTLHTVYMIHTMHSWQIVTCCHRQHIILKTRQGLMIREDDLSNNAITSVS